VGPGIQDRGEVSEMRKTSTIALTNLRRLLRDKTGAFFVLVFPFAIILVLGATFGQGFTPKLGVVAPDTPLAQDLVRRLEAVDGLEVVSYADADGLRDAVEQGALEGGVVIPADHDDTVLGGGSSQVAYLARPSGAGQELNLTVAAVADRQAVTVTAARIAVDEGAAANLDEALAAARAAEQVVPTVAVTARAAGAEDEIEYGMDSGAAQELVLFVFVTSLSASSMLIETRRLGVSRRMLASPTPAGTVVLGEALGRYAIALFQGALILLGTALLFGVDWGNPLTASLVVALFAATATGAAILMGSVMSNEQQAGSLGVFLGLALAALGGAMVPLEIFPPVMERIAHLTPHAWAIEALNETMATGAGPAAVATDLAVLAIYAAALIAVATALFRRRLTTASG
jgi:ABC-2 type transport system permease protein